jgi:hypothetical protein
MRDWAKAPYRIILHKRKEALFDEMLMNWHHARRSGLGRTSGEIFIA